jgi:hypothetical protein
MIGTSRSAAYGIPISPGIRQRPRH